MEEYYAKRAREYEKIYFRDDPIRQQELLQISEAMTRHLSGRRVLEVACGTGFWTEKLASSANSILATDAVDETLEVAKHKKLSSDRVHFLRADAYLLNEVPGTFDGGLANCWLSHVPRAKLTSFMNSFHQKLGPGSAVFMADNVYVPGLGGELTTKKDSQDTFKLRTLSDSTQHEILKNYPTPSELEELLRPRAKRIQIHFGACFWWLCYEVA